MRNIYFCVICVICVIYTVYPYCLNTLRELHKIYRQRCLCNSCNYLLRSEKSNPNSAIMELFKEIALNGIFL